MKDADCFEQLQEGPILFISCLRFDDVFNWMPDVSL